MKRVTMAYVLWLIALGTLMGVLLEWYRRVENIGWPEVIARLREPLATVDGAAPTDDNGAGE